MGQARFEIVDTPIVVEEVTDKVARRETGAITTFIGTVREVTKGKRTLHLEYEAYKPMAVKSLLKSEKKLRKMAGCKNSNHAPSRTTRNNGYCRCHCSIVTAS